jgi:hypothetical protein
LNAEPEFQCCGDGAGREFTGCGSDGGGGQIQWTLTLPEPGCRYDEGNRIGKAGSGILAAGTWNELRKAPTYFK